MSLHVNNQNQLVGIGRFILFVIIEITFSHMDQDFNFSKLYLNLDSNVHKF